MSRIPASAFSKRLTQILFPALFIFLCLFLLWILIISHSIVHLILIFIVFSVTIINTYTTALSGILLTGKLRRLISVLGHASEKIPLWIIIGIAFILRFAYGLSYGIIHLSDYATYYNNAVSFSNGDMSVLGSSKYPLVVIFYGGIFKLLHKSLIVVYVTNALLGCLQVFLVYKIATEIHESRGAAKFSALLVAIFASIVLHSSVVCSEMPYATILLVILWLALKCFGGCETITYKHIVIYAAIGGMLIAMLHLSRNTGILTGAWIVGMTLVYMRADIMKKLFFAATISTSSLLCLAPQIKYNHNMYGIISIQSSPFSALNLLMGTNRQSQGTYNIQDALLITARYPSFPDDRHAYVNGSRLAYGMAFKRIRDDLPGFVAFSLTTKFKRMWGSDDYSAGYLSLIQLERKDVKTSPKHYQRSKRKSRLKDLPMNP